jgi:hypothetical protein
VISDALRVRNFLEINTTGDHMFRLITTTSIVSLALGLSTLAGCASSTRGTESSKATASTATAATATAAMECPTCDAVWVHEQTAQGTKIQRFTSKKQMICPDCDATAVAYLDGEQKVLHNCPQCKVTPTPLAPASAPQPSHPKGTHS